jgi:DNA (cytosine-5)-methyltransferase 1
MLTFFEFFAGGGMARAGLGPKWRCLFANDFDEKKANVYRQNWGHNKEFRLGDVGSLTTAELPETARLVWASFPCQDLSLAGAGAGLKGDRSGTFWPFWHLMEGLIEEHRGPEIIVLENVCGTLNSHDGQDFGAICTALGQRGYSVGALVIDAARFVPQSRPRLFFVCPRNDVAIPYNLIASRPEAPWHTATLQRAFRRLPQETKRTWIWWSLPLPPERRTSFADCIEDEPVDVEWFTQEETQRLIAMMSEVNRKKLTAAQRLNRRVVGGLYRRTRRDEYGRKVQRAEIRFDDVSGCLRTPAGGSSRQVILVVNGPSVRARLISARETARLMGLPDTYLLPTKYNEAYHLTGDGVVVPVVRHLAEHLFEPLLQAFPARTTKAA